MLFKSNHKALLNLNMPHNQNFHDWKSPPIDLTGWRPLSQEVPGKKEYSARTPEEEVALVIH